MPSAETVLEAGEGVAGFDLGQLARITNQDNLRAAVLGIGEEAGECAGPDHRRLINDENGCVIECCGVPVDAGEEPVDRRAGDTGVVFEYFRSACGERTTDHPVTGRAPCVASCSEREGLACAGDAFDDLDPTPDEQIALTIRDCSPSTTHATSVPHRLHAGPRSRR